MDEGYGLIWGFPEIWGLTTFVVAATKSLLCEIEVPVNHPF